MKKDLPMIRMKTRLIKENGRIQLLETIRRVLETVTARLTM